MKIILSALTAVLLLFASPSSYATQSFTPCDKGLLPVNTEAHFLPHESSEVFQELVQKIRKDFAETKSFSTIDFAKLIPPQIVEELYATMNRHQAMRLFTGRMRTKDPFGIPFFANYQEKDMTTPVETVELMKIEEILSWFEKLLMAAFPQLSLRHATAQLRVTKELGNGHTGNRVWHQDGGAVNVFIPFDGPGPEVSMEPECPPLQFTEIKKMKQGQAIVMAGTNIQKVYPEYFYCIHRSTQWNGKRFAITMHFYLKEYF